MKPAAFTFRRDPESGSGSTTRRSAAIAGREERRGFGPAGRIDRHVFRNPGDWSVEDLFEELGAFEAATPGSGSSWSRRTSSSPRPSSLTSGSLMRSITTSRLSGNAGEVLVYDQPIEADGLQEDAVPQADQQPGNSPPQRNLFALCHEIH
jgi:hypothetical protein